MSKNSFNQNEPGNLSIFQTFDHLFNHGGLSFEWMFLTYFLIFKCSGLLSLHLCSLWSFHLCLSQSLGV